MVDLAQRAQNFANRGRQALEGKHYDLAVDMLNEAVALAPKAVEYRKLLRTAQVMGFTHSGKKPSIASKLSDALKRMKINALLKKGNAVEAMAEAEKLLASNPLDSDNISIAVKAAELAGLPEHAAITVEAAYEFSSKDVALLEKIATYYTIAKNWAKVCDAYKKILEMHPIDQRVLGMLKNAEAQLTMSSGWSDSVGKVGGYRNILKDKAQTESIDTAGKSNLTGNDLETLINQKKDEVAADPENVNLKRQLAKFLVRAKKFDEAIPLIEEMLAKATDPELDRLLSQTKLQQYDQKIDALRNAGDIAGADSLALEREEFAYNDLVDRVKRYPNDLHLHFELGRKQYDAGQFDEALKHLQIAQKSPKDRLWALFYLAMCFLQQNQVDMAVMQLETVKDQIVTMDELKKKATYWLGRCYEEALNDIDKAYALYKEVYAADVGFEDLQTRILAISKAQKERK